jgi:hypothetical protein
MKKLVLVSLVAASALLADPFVSYPGTKAKGMGGAFTAVANNNSAMYFNPAGMINFESEAEYTMITLEGGLGGKFDASKSNTDDVFTSNGNYFLAAGGYGSGWHGGMAIYSLYTIKTSAVDENGDYAGYKNQDISALSASFAYELSKQMYPGGGKLSIGTTLGVAFSGSGLMEMKTTKSDGSETSSYEDDTLDQRGYFAMVGLKARVLQTMTFRVDIGANYRTRAAMESVHDGSTIGETTPVNGMDMPSEFSMGVAAMYLSEYGVLTLSLDKKTTGYEEATSEGNSDMLRGMPDYSTLAMGIDLSGPEYQVRAGTYTSTPSEDDIEISGVTFGVGMMIGTAWNIEASVDTRKYTYGSFSTDETFGSLSLNYAIAY